VNNALIDTSDRELSTTRVFDAPRELVWEVWTNPKHIALWWGPNGFTNTIYSMDVRPGGVWDYMMHGPDGVDYPNIVSYLEVKKFEKLVYDHGDKQNPKMFHVTVTFESIGEKTQLTMRMVFPTKAARDEVVEKYGALEGQNQTLNKLEIYLHKIKE